MSTQNKGYLCILAAGTLWGSIGFFVRKLAEIGAEGMLASFMRIFTAWLILIPVLFFLGRRTRINYFKISKKGLLQCLLLGVCTQAFFNAAYSYSINTVGVGAASVLLYTEPVFVCLFSRMLFKEEIGPRKGISLVINLLGCFLMVTGGDLSVLQGSEKWIHHVHLSEPGLVPLRKRPLHRELAEFLRSFRYEGFVSIEAGRQEKLSAVAEMMEYVSWLFA